MSEPKEDSERGEISEPGETSEQDEVLEPVSILGYAAPRKRGAVRLANTSLTSGVISLVLCCVGFLSIPLAVLAVVCGAMVLLKVEKRDPTSTNAAAVGVVSGLISIALWVSIIAVYFFTH